MQADKNKQNRT